MRPRRTGFRISDSGSLLLRRLAGGLEEGLKQGEGFVVEDSGSDLGTMIEGGLLEEVEQATGGAPLGISDAEDNPADPTVDDGAGAHRTGLLGHVEVAIDEAPVSQRLLRLTQGQHLGVGGGVAQRLHLIVGSREDLATADDHRADGDFPRLESSPGLPQGLLHQKGIADEFDGGVRLAVG